MELFSPALLFLSIVNLASAQSDFRAFISLPDKFSSQSEPRKQFPPQGASRRSRFFPPPDRLSPTRRPIFTNTGGVPLFETTPKSISRFHPSTSRFVPPTTTQNINEYEEVYYEYYLENYDEENNNNNIPIVTTDPPVVITTSNAFNKISNFHLGSFRSTTESPTTKFTTKGVDRNQRFRFISTNERDRSFKSTPKVSTRKGLLADLLSKLTSTNNAETPKVEETRESKTLDENDGKDNLPTNIDASQNRLRYTETTTPYFEFTDDSENNVRFTTTIPIVEDVSERGSDLGNMIDGDINIEEKDNSVKLENFNVQRRPEVKKEEESVIVQRPPPTNKFSSLFENIQIAVDPSLLPPGYSVEEALTEKVADQSNFPTTSLPISLFEDDSKSSNNDLFTTTPREFTSVAPPDSKTEVDEVIFTTKATVRNEEQPVDESSNKITPDVDENINKLLNPSQSENRNENNIRKLPITPVDISKFLPPGFKPKKEPAPIDLSQISVNKVNIFDLINKNNIKSEKPDLKEQPKNTTPPKTLEPETTKVTTTSAPTTRRGLSGIVFPRRPNRPSYTESTTARPKISGPPPLKPKIQNLFDRIKQLGVTEYKVPIITTKTPITEATTSTSTTTTTAKPTTTTTTTTTTLRPVPTTPGTCDSDCELAGSLRLTSGTEWKPELANRDTFEFQILSNQIENELDAFFRSSSFSPWFDHVQVDSFNKGSVIVSYILFLTSMEPTINTADLKMRLNSDLQRVSNAIGSFEVDPEETDFRVIPKQTLESNEEKNFLIPEWLIAVIVIGLASFLFILVFGVVALVSRARVRKRANVPLTEEFLNNLNALQVNGMDNYAMNGMYGMEPVWNEKYLEKPMKPPSSKGKGYNQEYNVNIYDSWRTDYSGPVNPSTAKRSKNRSELNFEGNQFYKDDLYDF